VLPADALQADDSPAAFPPAGALRAAVPTASTARLDAVVTSVAERIEVASVVAPFRAADAVAWTAARVPPVVPAPAVAALASPAPAVAPVVPAPAEALHLPMAVPRALPDPPAADRPAPRAPGRGRPRRRAHGTKGDCDSERPSRRAMKMQLQGKR